MLKMIYPATPAKAVELRSNLTLCGVSKARVKQCTHGRLRLVIASVEDRDNARDALVLSNACTVSGTPFTDRSSMTAWNGPVEIFIRFAAP